MPARAVRLTVYPDLPQTGALPRAQLRKATAWQTSYRADGDHRLQGTWPRGANATAQLVVGDVLVVDRADGTADDWVVQQVLDGITPDTLQVTALPVLTWFGERVLVRSGATTSFTWTGKLSALVTLLLATTEWPSWNVAGTFDRDPVITVTLNAATGREALLALLTAANVADEVAWEGETMRLELRRVSSSQYALDFLTTPAPGTPALQEGKNITPPDIRQDRLPQAQDVFPIGAGDATIREAYFAVRSFSGVDLTVELRDWAYRPDRLVILDDGQWAGHYLVLPDGSRTLITASSAADQEVVVASVAGIGTNSAVRISPTAAGADLLHVPAAGAAVRKVVVRRGAWTGKVNWLANARWRSWVSSSVVSDWSVAGGMAIAQVTNPADIETGEFALETTHTGSGRTLVALSIEIPHSLLSPGGGTQTWVLGARLKRTVSGSGGTIALQYSKNGGGLWTSVGTTVTSSTYDTQEGTFTTNATNVPGLIDVRFLSNSGTATKYIIDRVWLKRQGIDDGDDTLEGCDPCRGIYEANRHLRTATDPRTYQFLAMDRFRADPTRYPFERLAVNQLARLRSARRDLDLSLPIVELDVDELIPIRTGVRVGTPRRRLTQLLRG